MSLYAMSDLHLSHFKPKPMDIFDEIWKDHPLKIQNNWNNIVSDDDWVIVPGDITWGGNMTEAMPDLDYISRLNGNKIIFQGNHDYFWNSTQRLNSMYDNMVFVKNSYYKYNDTAICGTRGWVCPNDSRYTPNDEKIYKREAGRLENSIKAAINDGYESVIVAMHFPPTNDKKEESIFVEILKKYSVKNVIYGHLHGKGKYELSYLGEVDGINYKLVSADYLNFSPIKIM